MKKLMAVLLALTVVVGSASAVLTFTTMFTGCDNAYTPSNSSESFYVTLYNTGSAPKSTLVTKGDSFTLPSYTRTYYTLDGWNTSTDGTGTSYSVGDVITVSSEVTLYGQWTINNATMTLTSSEYSTFVLDRNTFDPTLVVTVKISDLLPDAYDLSTTGRNLNITLDLSSCTNLVNLSDAYSFPKDIVGIVFPSSIKSIYTSAFYFSKDISSVVFSNGSPKSWYKYRSNGWDKTTNSPTDHNLGNFDLTDDSSANATNLKSSASNFYYWSTELYVYN